MDNNMILSNTTKKVLKLFHILFASFVTGSLFSILILLLQKQYLRVEGLEFAVDISLFKLFTWGVNYSFMALMVTSFVYGLFTEWGFARYHWIIIKWIIVIILFTVVWIGLGPAISGLTSISDAGFQNIALQNEYLSLGRKAILYTILELAGLIIIIMISVLKPGGKRRSTRYISRKKIMLVIVPIVIIGASYFTLSSLSLNTYRNMPIENSDLTKAKDGSYIGEAKIGSFIYKVSVEIKKQKITSIQSIDNRKSIYVTYAEGVFSKIIKHQNANVDAVTGATTTSKAFMKAVENALENASSK